MGDLLELLGMVLRGLALLVFAASSAVLALWMVASLVSEAAADSVGTMMGVWFLANLVALPVLLVGKGMGAMVQPWVSKRRRVWVMNDDYR
jgi:hypothetical protein